jgi:hypothetical protein
MTTHTTFQKSLAAASATSIAASQAATAGVALTLTATPVVIDAATPTNNALGRRVLITSTSGSETASIAITGTNSSGNTITETDTFSGSSTTLQSNLDYVTITSIVPSGTIVGSLSAGTNGVGSSAWYTWNWRGDPPMNLGFAVELVSGSVNYTVQYTYDDPNRLSNGITTPTAFNTVLLSQAATADSTISTPVVATRVLINSGTGVIRCRFMQAGMA